MAIDVRERYEQEREKRVRAHKGPASYMPVRSGPAKDILAAGYDQWVADGTPVLEPVPNGGHIKIIIFGAGIAGMLAAIQAIRGGAVSGPEEVLIVDRAGGFGGTWHYNRYPGLACDVESSLFLPLLETMDYIPLARYSGGEEIRQYLVALAVKFGLDKRTMFQSAGTSARWTGSAWACDITEKPKALPENSISVTADYTILSTGFFGAPRIPNLPGFDLFKGAMMHPSSWRYDVTGGSPTEPDMFSLTGKRVAIVGTSATSVQVMPELAKYAEHVYVFQRTPMAIDVKNNRPMEITEWKTKIANKPGWQRERGRNNQAFQENPDALPPVSLTGGDGWAGMRSIAGLTGTSKTIGANGNGMDEYFQGLQALDDAWMEKVRARTEKVVRDPATAEKLKPWHTCFCRPGSFSDSYLHSFNRPNVHLVDLDGRGVQSISANGLVTADGTEYPVDVIVWATGYGPPGGESLVDRGEMDIRGRDDASMSALARNVDLLTLHGMSAHQFPNFFMPGVGGAGVSVSQTMRLEDQGEHIAYIIAEASRRAKAAGKKVAVVEPTAEAVEAWAEEIARHSARTGAVFRCGPTALTLDGALAQIPKEIMPKVRRSGFYGRGYLEYSDLLRQWRANGKMEGLDVQTVS